MRKLMRKMVVLGMLMACLLPAAHAEEALTPAVPFNECFYNPLGIGGDPWIVQRDGQYVHTQSGGEAAKVTLSDTISGLWANRLQEKIVYWASSMGQTDIWAPEIHYYNGEGYLFYTATVQHAGPMRRIFVQRCTTQNPKDEWEFLGKVNLPEDQWAIDATFFPHNGKTYLIWSGWKNEAEGGTIWKQYLYIAELDQNDFTKAVSTQRVMISAPDYAWENGVLPQNEGPQILLSPAGTVYCIYSANFSKSNDYCLGALRLVKEDPLADGAWEKMDHPVFATSVENDVYAPGHASFTKSPDGTEDWILYHAARKKDSGWNRNFRAKKVEWVDDMPVLGEPDSLNTLIPLPSGEKVDRLLYRAADAALSVGAQVKQDVTQGDVVSFSGPIEKATFSIQVEKAGKYALYLRYSNPGDSESKLRVSVNGGAKQQLIAFPTGNGGSFTMTCCLAELQEGVNTIDVSAFGSQIALHCMIWDRAEIE